MSRWSGGARTIDDNLTGCGCTGTISCGIVGDGALHLAEPGLLAVVVGIVGEVLGSNDGEEGLEANVLLRSFRIDARGTVEFGSDA